MEPGSQTTDPAEQASHKLANLIGTVIALLTFTVPILAIVHFSSAGPSISNEHWQIPVDLLPRARE
jgi:cytochrome b561